MTDERKACENTDVPLFEDSAGNEVFATKSREGLGINVGGLVIVKAPASWHALARASLPQPAAAQPVAWGVYEHGGNLVLAKDRTLLAYFDNPPFPLYASLPPAVRLSDSEILACNEIPDDCCIIAATDEELIAFARAVLAAASAPKTEGDGNAS